MTIWQLIFGLGVEAPSLVYYFATLIWEAFAALGIALPWAVAWLIAETMFL